MIISWLLLIIVLIIACYLPAYVLFHDHSRSVSLAQVWMYIATGLGSLGILTICVKAAGLDMRFSLAPGILLSLYAIFAYKTRCIPEFQMSPCKIHTLFVLIVSGLYVLHILVQGIQLGTGDYPAVFTEFDVVYYLGHIHSFLRYDAWPPLSLNNLGVAVAHHFGAQASSAMLSAITGFPAHTAFFLIFMPLVALGVVSAVWLLAQEIAPSERAGDLLWIGMLLILYASFYPLYPIVSIVAQAFSSIRALGSLPYLMLDPDSFGLLTDFHLIPSSHFGLFSMTILLYCLQDISNGARQRLAAFIVGSLIIFKMPYFLTAGFGFGAWVLGEIYRTHRFRLILAPGSALLLAIFLNSLSNPAKAFSLVFKSVVLLTDPEFGMKTMGGIVIIGAIVLFLPKRISPLFPSRVWHYWWFILPPFVIANLITTSVGGKIFKYDMFQICAVIPTVVATFAFAAISFHWNALTNARKRAILIYIALMYLAPFSHKVLHTVLPLSAPQLIRAETTDNRALAEALRVIPLRASVIVTNETGYPWKDAPEDWLQVKFSGLFGHQMYAANYIYEQYYGEHIQRNLELQRRFRSSTWDAELERLAQELGWTHLVIYRPSPHPEHIPLPLIFENGEYQVYEFNKE